MAQPVGAANKPTHPNAISARIQIATGPRSIAAVQATRLPSIAAAMLSNITDALRGPPEAADHARSAEDTKKGGSNVVEPIAAAQAAPPQGNAETSSGSDGRGGSGHGVELLSNLLGRGESDLDLEIARLKAARESMKQEKKRVSGKLRNTERKRARLKSRAKLLSTNDLLEVYAMRCRSKDGKDTKSNAPSKEPVPAAAGVSPK